MFSVGTWKWSKVRGEGASVIGVEVVPHLDHVSPFPPVLQCWNIELFLSIRVGHVLGFGGSPAFGYVF